MIYSEELKKQVIECSSCSNNKNTVCPCSIFVGNPELPNLFNKPFPDLKELKRLKKEIHNKIYGKYSKKTTKKSLIVEVNIPS